MCCDRHAFPTAISASHSRHPEIVRPIKRRVSTDKFQREITRSSGSLAFKPEHQHTTKSVRIVCPMPLFPQTGTCPPAQGYTPWVVLPAFWLPAEVYWLNFPEMVAVLAFGGHIQPCFSCPSRLDIGISQSRCPLPSGAVDQTQPAVRHSKK